MPPATTPKRNGFVIGGLMVVGLVALTISFIQSVRVFATLPETDGAFMIVGVPIAAFIVSVATVLVTLATAWTAQRERLTHENASPQVPLGFAALGFGLVGLYAAFVLAADKVVTITEPTTQLGCDLSVLVQCGANLESWQGSVFGFPSPLIGLAGWAAVVTIGCLLLSGVRLAAWFWITVNIGVACAMAFVVWLIAQSVFVLGTLCPWCMVTWAVTIPLFWAVTLHNAEEGRLGRRIARAIGPAYGWVPAITVASYIVVAIIAQLRLDLLSYL